MAPGGSDEAVGRWRATVRARSVAGAVFGVDPRGHVGADMGWRIHGGDPVVADSGRRVDPREPNRRERTSGSTLESRTAVDEGSTVVFLGLAVADLGWTVDPSEPASGSGGSRAEERATVGPLYIRRSRPPREPRRDHPMSVPPR